MKIGELLDGIQKLDLVMPEFQREYVWDREQAKQLMVSLYREYPTGGLLFWKTDNPPDIKNATVDKDKVGTTLVILDGQQRLTTLFLLIRGAVPPYYREEEVTHDPRNLYFNLDTAEFRYYQLKRMETDPTWVAVVDCFSDEKRVNPLQIAQARTGDAAEQMRLADLFYERLSQLRNIRDRDYPVQVVPPSADIDDAIDVFDRVNSLGTKLTDAELALAHITGKWPDARRALKAKIDELEGKRFAFDLTFMVRALLGVVKNRALFPTIHTTPKGELVPGWERASRILDYLVSVLPGRAFVHSTDDLNSTNNLIPVIAHLALRGGRFQSDEDLRRCLHWLYAANTWARYSSQTDNRLDHDLAVVQRLDSPWAELTNAIIDQRGRLEVTAGDFEGRSTQHPLYRMAYVVIKSLGAVDWFNGSPLAEPHGRHYQIHSHHVFPSSLLYREGGYESENHLHVKLVNEIANRAFLTGTSNVSLGNEHPEVYLADVEARFPGALRAQCVPADPALWRLDRYEDFLAERRRLLAAALNARMAELAAGPPTDERRTLPASELVALGESAALEYKSTLRWDLRQRQVNKALEKVVAKSIAGFLNAEGGTLLIGVADDGEVLGLQPDLESLGRGDLDGFAQKLVQVLSNHLGPEYLQLARVRFDAVEGHPVCIVEVDPSPRPVYLKDGGGSEFYARVGNTTRPFDMQSAHDYIQMHWQP